MADALMAKLDKCVEDIRMFFVFVCQRTCKLFVGTPTEGVGIISEGRHSETCWVLIATASCPINENISSVFGKYENVVMT